MKKLILSAMLLTGMVTFAQETPKKVKKEVKQTTTTVKDAEKATKTTQTTEVKTDPNGDQQVETVTTKTAVPVTAPATEPAKKNDPTPGVE